MLIVEFMLGLVAMAPGSNDRLAPGHAPKPIIGGEPATMLDGVVRVVGDLESCSGVMVSSTVLLTAGHCLDELEFDSAVAVYRGSDEASEELFQGGRWGLAPDYCFECDGAWHDLGYVELVDEFVPSNGFAPPIALASEWDAVMRAGTELTIAGYGEPDGGTRRQVASRVAEVIEGGQEFVAGGDGKGACLGDSGGPAFVEMPDGGRRLMGIFSRGYGCGENGIYTTPYPELCWLRDETSVDLLPPSCSGCDCIDLRESGCGCAVRDRNPPDVLLWPAAIAFVRRRRRLH